MLEARGDDYGEQACGSEGAYRLTGSERQARQPVTRHMAAHQHTKIAIAQPLAHHKLNLTRLKVCQPSAHCAHAAGTKQDWLLAYPPWQLDKRGVGWRVHHGVNPLPQPLCALRQTLQAVAGGKALQQAEQGGPSVSQE